MEIFIIKTLPASVMKEELRKCIDTMRKGGTILYPTDTVWGIGCDATNARAVTKIYRIKMRMEGKKMIVLLDRKEKLNTYVAQVPDIAYDLIDRVNTPLTIIYPNAKNLAKNIVGDDGSIAIRIIHHDFCNKLVRMYGKPIVSTSANLTGEAPPLLFKNIPQQIQNQVNYAVNLGRNDLGVIKPSTIIKLLPDGQFEIIRK